jgi:hypothetical protein
LIGGVKPAPEVKQSVVPACPQIGRFMVRRTARADFPFAIRE